MERKTMQAKANTRYERCSYVGGKAAWNRHSRFGTALGRALLSGAGRIVLFSLMGMAVVLCTTKLGFAQLADSPWPMRGHDVKHTGQSPYKGPQAASLKWKFKTGNDASSSPAIGPDGTIYAGASDSTVGSTDNYFYALNPDGSLKWKSEMGRPEGGSPAIGSDDTVYVGSWDGNLYAFALDGSLKWKFKTGEDIFSSPAIGSDGTV